MNKSIQIGLCVRSTYSKNVQFDSLVVGGGGRPGNRIKGSGQRDLREYATLLFYLFIFLKDFIVTSYLIYRTSFMVAFSSSYSP